MLTFPFTGWRRVLALAPLTVCLVLALEAKAEDLSTETLWRIDTGEAIYPKPRLDGDTLYVGGEDGIVRAIDKDSGEVIWAHDSGAAVGSGVSFDEMRVYYITRDGRVHALWKQSGEPVWAFETGGEAKYDYWDYVLSTPVPDNRRSLYFGSGDHHVYAVNKRTGKLFWKTGTGGVVHGDLALSGEWLIAGSFDGKLYAFDSANGDILWTFKTVGNSYFRNGAIPGSPTVHDGLVYFGSRDYNLYAVIEDTGTGAWNERTPSWVVAKPLVVEDGVYIGISDGPRALAYNARSGRQQWETRLSLNVFGGAEAMAGGAVIAVAGFDGRITFLARESGEVLGHHDTREARQNRSRFFDREGKLQPGELNVLEDLMDLNDRFFSELGGIVSGLVVDGDVIYYATGSGGIAAVRVDGLEEVAPAAEE